MYPICYLYVYLSLFHAALGSSVGKADLLALLCVVIL